MRVRPIITLTALAVVTAACSGSSESSSADTDVEPAAVAATTVATPEAPPDAEAAPAATVPAEPPPSVRLTATASGFGGADATIDTVVAPDGPNGPFDTFASCSGLREHVGAYSVFVSDDGGAVNVWTPDRVMAAGIYDAEVRVEPLGGEPLDASGTVTLLDGLQTGEFLAFGPDGGRVEGSFECTGAPSPIPLGVGDPADGELESVEVFALLRSGDAERVVGLATDGTASVACSGAAGGDVTGLVVRADGDAGLGAITTFELSDEPATARLRVGGAQYEFTDVTLLLEPDGAAGAFSAVSADGMSVDGAFRCA